MSNLLKQKDSMHVLSERVSHVALFLFLVTIFTFSFFLSQQGGIPETGFLAAVWISLIGLLVLAVLVYMVATAFSNTVDRNDQMFAIGVLVLLAIIMCIGAVMTVGMWLGGLSQ